MFADLPIQFDRPGWLLLLLLIVVAFLIARRSIGGLSRRKAYTSFALRAVVIALLSTALARPVWQKRGEGLTVTIILDRSLSVPRPLQRFALDFVRAAAEMNDDDDNRLAVITVARDPVIVALPDRYSAVPDELQDPPDLTATNLAAGIRTALAIMPDDTANRFVVVSDGNETIDSVLAAAELAKANDVRVDVLVLEYEHANEVLFERIVAPARARQGQSATIKLVLRSQSNASGLLTLTMNGEPLDLNGEAPGTAARVTLQPGPNVIPVTISLDESGPLQFRANFEPDADAKDNVQANNTAVAVTFVGGEGKVLIIDETGAESQHLVQALRESKITVHVEDPEALSRGLVFLSGYDAVVLANTPRFAVTDDEDRMLRAYVHDLGGGLVMLGGPLSFGAGGWINSEVAKALPVKLDPPQTRQMVRGALALIMHSTEMPQGNYWGQTIAIAAIDALSSLDYVGILDYGMGGVVWEWGPDLAGDKSAPIAAAKKMVMGDMPDFASAMQLALQGLDPLPAGQKHVIIISDGDPQAPSQKLLDDFLAANITISTVLIAGHGSAMDVKKMKAIAEYTGGTPYGPIRNPKKLPEIFIKEAKFVSRSLIVEGEFQPIVVSRLPGPIEGFSAVPGVDGYVLTVEREGLSQIPIISPTSEGNDPIYAHWNYGLGKSIAYTSDLTGTWGSRWASWPRFRTFWEQSIRWVMRPSAPSNLTVNTRQEGDQAIIEVEALDVDASYLNFLRTSAVVLHPDGEAVPLLLQQTGPGRYRGQFPTDEAGAYLVNINYLGGTADEPIEGNLQAAVSVPYPREFRYVKHNAALLRELAERTGGRVLSGANPQLVDLFYDQELELPLSPKSTWDLMTILAAALFLLDVATRRISVDRQMVAAAAARVVGRRAEVGTETVSAWKRTRASVTKRREVATKAAQAAARFEAGEADSSTAIDVGSEAVGQPGAEIGRAKSAPAPTDAEAQPDEGEYTSRLLAAKRRARGETEEQSGDSADG